MEATASISITILASAELVEVLGSLGSDIIEELKGNPSLRSFLDPDVEVNLLPVWSIITDTFPSKSYKYVMVSFKLSISNSFLPK